MNVSKNDVIGNLVAQDYRFASVFKSHKIDFCCQGNKTIEEACNKKNIDVETVLCDLEFASQKKESSTTDFNTWSLDLLIDHIEKNHHRFVEQSILEIKPYLNKVSSVHGDRHPELIEINHLFTAAASDLTNHMNKEEKVLFPYVRQLLQAKQENLQVDEPPFVTIQNPLLVLAGEHDTEGDRFRKIAALSNNYTPPEDACNTYKVTFALLQEFEEDLHLHIHLENNILFPKALELENDFACV